MDAATSIYLGVLEENKFLAIVVKYSAFTKEWCDFKS
jgi:hypothetical protein